MARRPSGPDGARPPNGRLRQLLAAAAARLGCPGFDDPLGLPPARGVVALLVDGLGWCQLLDHPGDAPFLAALAASGRPLGAEFPATTPVSLASLGTGASPGAHGIVGFSARLPGSGPVDFVAWADAGGRPLLEEQPPERVQPLPTVFDRAAVAGLPCAVVAPAAFAGSGLTRAALRGAPFRGAYSPGDLVGEAAAACRGGVRLVYAYLGELDAVGHRRGPGSPAWRVQLRMVDQAAAELARALPPGYLLAVTADHGMSPLPPERGIDVDATPELLAGVCALAGEARARHVYCAPGREEVVLAAWRARLGEAFDVVSRDEAVAAGWFGEPVSAAALPRIGDVVAVSRGDGWLPRGRAEPAQAAFRGGHGSRTDTDALVPLLLAG